jgi:phage shock protein PspC (stress-responsive transcriptional regulator)
MKKTVIVNINGIIFHIDEDAYGNLNAYLDALHRYFDHQAEGKEIVMDIEARIAELLQPLISEAKQSVTINDVENIISALGKPEDIAGAGNIEEEPQPDKQEQASSRRYSRRLYRDPDNAILGGVCAGMASYFDVDPVLIRIIFIALFFAGGVSIIIYPILWIAVPMAQTAAQKLEMRGESITINNIERTHHTSEEPGPNSFWERIRAFISEVFGLFGKVFFAIWRVIVFLMGAFLIAVSVIIIISLTGAVFFNNFNFTEIAGSSAISVKEFLTSIISPTDTTWLLIVLLFVAFIPLIGLIYAGLKLVIRFKAKDKWAILSMLLLWIVSIIIGTVLIFSQVNNFRIQEYEKESVTLSTPKGNIIYLSITQMPGNDDIYKLDVPPPGFFGIRTKDNKPSLWGLNRLDIEKSSKSYPELEIIREARGIDQEKASEAAKQIKTSYTQNDSALFIDPAFWVTQGKWKFQKVKIILHLPVGTKIYLDPNIAKCLNYAPNTDDYWNQQMTGKTWEMTFDGLRQIGEKKAAND